VASLADVPFKQTARRRERAWLLLQTGIIDRPRLRALLDAQGIHMEIPDDV